MAATVRAHVFTAGGSEPVETTIVDESLPGMADDEGALIRGRPAQPTGESRSLSPEEIEIRRAAATEPPAPDAAPRARRQKVTAAPRQSVAKVVVAPPIDVTSGVAMRARVLEMAVASGHGDPTEILRIAHDYLDFIMGADDGRSESED